MSVKILIALISTILAGVALHPFETRLERFVFMLILLFWSICFVGGQQ